MEGTEPQRDSPAGGSVEGRLPTILAELPAAVAVLEGPDHVFSFANELYVRLIGGRNPVGLTVREALPEVEDRYFDLLDEVYEKGESYVGQEAAVTLDRQGDGTLEEAFVNFVYLPTRDARGATRGVLMHAVEVTDLVRSRRQSESLARALELIATGAPCEDVLRDLVLMLEAHGGPNLLGSIQLLDSQSEHLRHGAAPSLPADYNAAIDGTTIGPAAGSFGAAAYTGQALAATDIASDPHWAELRGPALAHGLETCWSTPIVSTKGELLGVLSGYRSQGSPPGPHDDKLVETVVRTAAIAIERNRLEEEREALYASERSAREKAEDRARAALSLEYVADGVCLLDRAGIVRLWNPAAAQILAITEKSIIGRPIVEVIPGWESVSDQGRTGRDLAPTVTIPIQRAGRELWLSISGVAFLGGTVYAFRDVSAEHEIETLRADIVATVSHELRTPLAAVYGAAKTLQRVDLPVNQREALVAMVGSESERLRVLVDEILLASQLESDGGLTFDLEPLDVSALALALVEGMEAATGRAIQLVVPTTPTYAVANEQRLQQVLANLIDNAVKYAGPTGEILLTLEPLDETVRLHVADEGPGIPPGEEHRIFEKFYRLDPGQRQGIGGTGLGLYICKELVKRMKGRIWVESRQALETGSVFSVELSGAPVGER